MDWHEVKMMFTLFCGIFVLVHIMTLVLWLTYGITDNEEFKTLLGIDVFSLGVSFILTLTWAMLTLVAG